jgi:hypothetical protein
MRLAPTALLFTTLLAACGSSDDKTLTDPCTVDNGGCDALTVCDSEQGRVTCGACPAGYSGDGTSGCVASAPGPCATNNGGCDALTSCTETDGQATCSACPSGYKGSGSSGCVVDPCATANGGCDPLTTCTSDNATVTCGACPVGYSGDGKTGCVALPPCTVNNGGCDPLVTCTEQNGVAVCGACPVGYTGDGKTGCHSSCVDDAYEPDDSGATQITFAAGHAAFSRTLTLNDTDFFLFTPPAGCGVRASWTTNGGDSGIASYGVAVVGQPGGGGGTFGPTGSFDFPGLPQTYLMIIANTNVSICFAYDIAFDAVCP